MKKYFIILGLIASFTGCVETPKPIVVNSKSNSSTYVKKHNRLFYEKKLKELRNSEKEIIESINKSIEEYERNKLPKKNTYTDIYLLDESIVILKKISSRNHFESTSNHFSKSEEKITFDVDKIIKILNSQLKGKSFFKKMEIKNKIIFLKKIKKEKLKHRKEVLERSIQILKRINNDNAKKLKKPKKNISKLIKEFKKGQENKLKKLKENQKIELNKYTKKIKKMYGQEKVISIFEIRDTINVLETVKNKEPLGVFHDIKKSIKTLEEVKKIIKKNKKYSQKVLIEKENEEKSRIYERQKYEKIEKEIFLLAKKKKEIDKQIIEYKTELKSIEKSEKDKNSYQSYSDSSFFGKASFSKSYKPAKKLQNNMKVASHKYTLINSLEKLEELKSIRTYVLFPKNFESCNKTNQSKARYIKVLELIQTLEEVSNNKSNVDNHTEFNIYENKFVLFGDKKEEKYLNVKQYNYKISNTILDILRNRIDNSFLNKDGPFLITMTDNILNKDDGYEFIYIDLSEFNNSAIEEVINTYKNRLEENGSSDIKLLERFRLKFLSAITNFNDRIHLSSELLAGE